MRWPLRLARTLPSLLNPLIVAELYWFMCAARCIHLFTQLCGPCEMILHKSMKNKIYKWISEVEREMQQKGHPVELADR